MQRARTSYSAAISNLETIIQEEMRGWNIGGIACALVDEQNVVWAAALGEANRDSTFRVGSISKLFNALAVMQQVEAGILDLDAPLPADVLPLNPFPEQPAVTLRQILCHRSGLPRESAVGGYYDHTQPSLAATVASATHCVLVTRPGEKTRYSNLGPAIAGHLVERISGESYEDYQQARLLHPLGMTSSSWTLGRTPRDRIVTSRMRVADGQGGWTWRKAPLFDCGGIPAGNLFSTVDDLAKFASAMMTDGGGLVKPETLRQMWQSQLTEDDVGYGLGFLIGKFREHRTVSHSGSVYGYSSSLVILPEKKIAVIVLGNEDNTAARIHRISDAALSMMLETKCREAPPKPAMAFQPGNLAAYAGDYESQSYWCHLQVHGGTLTGDISGQPTQFAPAADRTFTAHSGTENATPVRFERDDKGNVAVFTLGIQNYRRIASNPTPLPTEWRAFLGSYGPDFIPLVVTERHGHLYAMTENLVDYRLTPMNRNVCALPLGMYADEQAVFLNGPDGNVDSVIFANMTLPRAKKVS